MKWLLPLLFLPLSAFGALTVTDRGTGSASSSNGTPGTLVAQPTSTIAAGSTGVLCLAVDNGNGASTNLPTSITDSVGNVWYQRNTATGGTANANVETAMYTATINTQLTSSNNVTISFTTAAVAVKVYTFTEVTPASGKLALYKSTTASVVNGSSAASTITTVANVSIGDVTVGMVGVEFGGLTITADSDTANGSWTPASPGQTVTAGAASAAGLTMSSQSKIQTTVASTQTYNTAFTSNDWKTDYVTFGETDLKARACTGATASATTALVVPALPLTAGSAGVLALAADNAGTSGTTANFPSTCSDGTNTWSLNSITGIFNVSGVSTGTEVGIYVSILTGGLTPSSTITCTFPTAVSAKVWALWEFAPTGAGPMSYVTGAVGSGATTGTPSVTTSSIANGDYVIGMVGAEGIDSFTGTTDSTNGTFSSQLNNSLGTGSAGMAITSQWKKVTGAGAQTYAPTLTSADTKILWVQLNDASPTGLTAAQKAAFFMLFP